MAGWLVSWLVGSALRRMVEKKMRRENKKVEYEGKRQSGKVKKKDMRRRKGYPGEEMGEGKEGEK